MPTYSLARMTPIIDVDNPMYCPEVTAHQYIASVKLFQAALEEEKSLHNNPSASIEQFPYFHKLRLAFDSDTSLYAPAYDQLSPGLGRKTTTKKPLISTVNDSSMLDMDSLLESPVARNAVQTTRTLTSTTTAGYPANKEDSGSK